MLITCRNGTETQAIIRAVFFFLHSLCNSGLIFLDNLSEIDVEGATPNGPGTVHKYYVCKAVMLALINIRMKGNSPPRLDFWKR
jgi:hypothetical protein